MQEDSELHFSSKYEQALAQYLAKRDLDTLQQAREIAALAMSLGVPFHEMVAVHAAAFLGIVPKGGAKECTVAAEFLTQSLQALEAEVMVQRANSLKRAAHELRTPLTTLRLALQLGLGRLEKGGAIDAPMLQKSLAQVDKLTAAITELVSRSVHSMHSPPSLVE
jgi:signal transduction histidine kinase